MEVCTLTGFRNALLSGSTHFRTLNSVDADITTLHCCTHFAECHAKIAKRPAIIYAPITPEARNLALRASRALYRCEGEHSPKFQIMLNEMQISAMEYRYCTVIIEYIKHYRPLEEALHTDNRHTLLLGLESLKHHMQRNNISHNNLTISNIFVDDNNCWHTIRNYYSTIGYGGDEDSFESLFAAIDKYAPQHQTSTQSSDTILTEELSEYRVQQHTSPYIEGLRRIERTEGWGFENEQGVVVIPTIYSYVYNFDEGRAKVITKEHHEGLIDTSGNEIIKAIYDEVDYDNYSGNSWVYKDGKRALFDYMGIQIIDWDFVEEE